MAETSESSAAESYPALPAEHSLRPVLESFDAAGKLIGGWTCDGGAACLTHLLDRAGIPYEPQAGLYYWFGDKLPERWTMVGDPLDPDVQWDPEHHHWIESCGYVIDPNGEFRGEPRVQTREDAYKHVDPDNRWSPDRYQLTDSYDVLSCSPWYEAPSDGDWEAGCDGELVIPELPSYEHELPAWRRLRLL